MKTSFITPLIVASCICHAQTPLNAHDALKLAAQNRPALMSAKLSIDKARSSARSLSAYPPLNFGLGASTRNGVGATDQDLILSQSIDLFGRKSADRRVGEAGIQLALAEYLGKASELQNEVLTAFSESVATKHQHEVANELLKVSEALLTVTKRRFEEEKIAELQVTRASIEYRRAKQLADLRSADLQASLKRLGGLLGMDSKLIEVQSDAVIEPLSHPGPDGRADIMILKAQAMIADAEAGTARTSNRPELSLQLVRSPWGDDRGYFVGRAQISWAIFDHGKAKSEERAAKLKAEAARKLLDDTTLRAKAEIEATQLEVEVRQGRIKSYEAILASARELVSKSQKGFSEGFGTQIDVLEATRALREVEQELVEARQQLSLAVISQYRAAGFLAEVLK